MKWPLTWDDGEEDVALGGSCRAPSPTYITSCVLSSHVVDPDKKKVKVSNSVKKQWQIFKYLIQQLYSLSLRQKNKIKVPGIVNIIFYNLYLYLF